MMTIKGTTRTGGSHGSMVPSTAATTRTNMTTSTTTTVDSKPAINLLERLSWVLYQDQYWWPAVIYQDYNEYLSHLRPHMDLNTLGQVGWKFLTATADQPYQGHPKSLRLARLLGRPLFEFVLLPPQQGPTDDPNCRNFYVFLGEIVGDQTCKPGLFPPGSLYLDFHRGLDEATSLLTLSSEASSQSTKWLVKAEQAAQDRQQEHPAPRSPVYQHPQQAPDASPAAASVAVVSVADSYVSISARPENHSPATYDMNTPMKSNRRVATAEDEPIKVSTPLPSPGPPPAPLEGSPIPPHANWMVVWEKLNYNGWSCRATSNDGILYSPPPTADGRVESWDLEQVQDYARQHYGWTGNARRRESTTGQGLKQQKQKPMMEAAERPTRSTGSAHDEKHSDYYRFCNLWSLILKPHGWTWGVVPHKLNRLWHKDYVFLRPGRSVKEEGLGRDFFKTEDDVVEFCKRQRYHEEFPYDTDNNSSCSGNEEVGSPDNSECNGVGSQDEKQPEEESADDESGDSEEEEEQQQECSSQNENDTSRSSDDNEPMPSEEEESTGYMTPPDSKTLPQDPSRPRLTPPSGASCSSQESERLSEKSFREIWSFLKKSGWTVITAKNALDDWWYVRRGRSAKGTEGVDYFRTKQAVVEYMQKQEEVNQPKKKSAEVKAKCSEPVVGRKRSAITESPEANKTFAKRVATGLRPTKNRNPAPQKPNWEVENPIENDAPWAIVPFLTWNKAWFYCQRLGVRYSGNFYYLPNESRNNCSKRFGSIDELQLHFCREGIPNPELLGEEKDAKGFSVMQLFQHWVNYTDIQKCNHVTLKKMRWITDDEATKLLVKLGFSMSDVGGTRKWKSPTPLYFRGITESEFCSLSRLRLFLRAVDNVEQKMTMDSSTSERRSRTKLHPKLDTLELLALRLWAAADSPSGIPSHSGTVQNEECAEYDRIEDNTSNPSADGSSVENSSVQNMACDDFSSAHKFSEPTSARLPEWRSRVNDYLFNAALSEDAWKLVKKIGVEYKAGSYRLPHQYFTEDLKTYQDADLTSTNALRQFLCLHRRYHVLLDCDTLNEEEKQWLYVWIETAHIQLRSWTSLEKIPSLSDDEAMKHLSKSGLFKKGECYFLAYVDPSIAINGVNCFQGTTALHAFIRSAEDLEKAFTWGSGADSGRRFRHMKNQRSTKPLWSEKDEWALRLWSLSSLDPITCLHVPGNSPLDGNDESMSPAQSHGAASDSELCDVEPPRQLGWETESSYTSTKAEPISEANSSPCQEATRRFEFTTDEQSKEGLERAHSNFGELFTQPDSGDSESDVEPDDDTTTTRTVSQRLSGNGIEAGRVSFGPDDCTQPDPREPEDDGASHECATQSESHGDAGPPKPARVSLCQEGTNTEEMAQPESMDYEGDEGGTLSAINGDAGAPGYCINGGRVSFDPANSVETEAPTLTSFNKGKFPPLTMDDFGF